MKPTRHIVITGCSRGIGRAMVSEFAQLGHTVSGCARSPSAIAELAAQFTAPHSFHSVDVADAAQVKSWSDRLLAEQGPPDLLINNAALINQNASLWEVPEEEFAAMIQVNIGGVFLVTRSFLPAMIEAGQGVIVNLSSGWGRSVAPQVAPYCATKWAIEGMTKALAEELPSGLAAIPLNPGVINTDMLQTCWGSGADGCISAESWAQKAVPFLLKLGPSDNGMSLTAP